jgi:hypothetical protein
MQTKWENINQSQSNKNNDTFYKNKLNWTLIENALNNNKLKSECSIHKK